MLTPLIFKTYNNEIRLETARRTIVMFFNVGNCSNTSPAQIALTTESTVKPILYFSTHKSQGVCSKYFDLNKR